MKKRKGTSLNEESQWCSPNKTLGGSTESKPKSRTKEAPWLSATPKECGLGSHLGRVSTVPVEVEVNNVLYSRTQRKFLRALP